MNADRRKALIACAAIRVILRGMPLDEALAAALDKAGAQVSEIERVELRRDVEHVLAGGRWPDKPGQLEAAFEEVMWGNEPADAAPSPAGEGVV